MLTTEEAETMNTQITQLLERNKALQASVKTIQQQHNQEKAGSHHGELDEPEPQPLSTEIWNAPVLEGFKSASRWKKWPNRACHLVQHQNGRANGSRLPQVQTTGGNADWRRPPLVQESTQILHNQLPRHN